MSSEANDQSISIESVNGEVTFLEGPTMPENLTPLSGLRAFDLSGKTDVVTGGAGGIGRALALGLAECGADVVVASR